MKPLYLILEEIEVRKFLVYSVYAPNRLHLAHWRSVLFTDECLFRFTCQMDDGNVPIGDEVSNIMTLGDIWIRELTSWAFIAILQLYQGIGAPNLSKQDNVRPRNGKGCGYILKTKQCSRPSFTIQQSRLVNYLTFWSKFYLDRKASKSKTTSISSHRPYCKSVIAFLKLPQIYWWVNGNKSRSR